MISLVAHLHDPHSGLGVCASNVSVQVTVYPRFLQPFLHLGALQHGQPAHHCQGESDTGITASGQ